MAREDRFYAFIIAHTSRSRARVQRIRVEKRSVTIFCAALLLLGVGLFYGLYGLTQQAAHLRTEFENQRFARKTNASDRNWKNSTTASRRSKILPANWPKNQASSKTSATLPGTGGPALPLDEMGLATLAAKMGRLEEDMRAYEAILRQRGYTPTVWPVDGKLEGGFGGRRNPFGGGGYEFHSGQDIEAALGSPGGRRRQRQSLVRWLAKRLRTTRRRGPWRRPDYTVRPPFAHRRRARTRRSVARNYWAKLAQPDAPLDHIFITRSASTISL